VTVQIWMLRVVMGAMGESRTHPRFFFKFQSALTRSMDIIREVRLQDSACPN